MTLNIALFLVFMSCAISCKNQDSDLTEKNEFKECSLNFDDLKKFLKTSNSYSVKFIDQVNLIQKMDFESGVKEYCKERKIASFNYDLVDDLFEFMYIYKPAKFKTGGLGKIMPNYNPLSIDPPLSYSIAHKKDKEVYLAQTFASPNYWKEVCLGESKEINNKAAFLKCYSNTSTRLKLRFLGEQDFMIHNFSNECLECVTDQNIDSWKWNICSQDNKNQIFNQKEYVETFKSFDLISKQGCKSKNIPLHFRDAFHKISIDQPIKKTPTLERFLAYTGNPTPIKAKHKMDIFFIWMDTLRNDFINLMPTLKSFKDENISFTNYFSTATNTRTTAFATFNSRSPTEWMKFLKQSYGKNGVFNFNVLKRAGYDVHGYGYDLVVLDEALIMDAFSNWQNIGRYYDENPKSFMSDYVFYHRNLFDFQKSLKERKNAYEKQIKNGTFIDGVNAEEYHTDTPMFEYDAHTPVVFEKVMNSIASDENKNKIHLIRLGGLHDPYISNPKDEADGNVYYPAFFPIKSRNTKLKQVINPFKLSELIREDKLKLPYNKLDYFFNSYANAAKGADFLLEQVLKTIKSHGKYDNSIVVIMGDHGESLGENQYFGHGATTVSWILTNTPVFYRIPGKGHQILDKIGTQYDIFPTIFNAIGLETDSEYNSLNLGNDIFSKISTDSCFLSAQPNFYSYQVVDFALFNGKEKLRARFCNMETKPNKDGSTIDHPETSPLYSTCIEPVAYTDQKDVPLNPGDYDHFEEKIKKEFKSCFDKYF